MNATNGREHGTTLVGLLAWGVVLVAFTVLAAKILPVYYEYWSVVNAVKAQAQSTDARASERDVREALLKRLEVADVTHVESDDIQIERDSGNNPRIRVAYERRVHLFGNMSGCFDFTTQSQGMQVE
ncbi:DUF4845 domain-containing protein [Thermithiobacillus plumbiphilus]|uniref:DUF4845 domain-containing protein n=1 Tax=Thermithiobacillus plumbiphilus TaxID=1729899 RepID=A0ABU9DBL2_9PROT